ncbi:DUF3667 domain-containing protein [Microbulbifer yueqingensis]|uniref:DUF3667 domain-containing protein n=1 Tax=Microbulbifer yueqingensis TaxID=658219 RepID=A0A1G9CLR4_9GAMM|nr:DUF3667 domain-containing protein [Microbulbifer yueqingensis]SDK52519.1 Protein of unknown function [Microbulbifer yueqingensis]
METEVLPNSTGEEAAESHSPPVPAEQPPACANCGTPLLGPHCYQCGQSRDSLVRHLPGILSDFFSTLLALDSRVWRTLGPLFAKPGFLSREYFAGRRARYVSPVRLFIFLSLAAVFLMRVAISVDGAQLQESRFDDAATVAEVERMRTEMLAQLDRTRQDAGNELAIGALDAVSDKLNSAADARIAELTGEPLPEGAAPVAQPEPKALLLGTCEAEDDCTPRVVADVDFEGWPAKEWLEEKSDSINANLKVAMENPDRFKDTFFRNIPTLLILLLPVFALLLWLFYLYRGWLYMEHVIVALHSHAFLFLGLVLLTLLSSLEEWLEGSLPLAASLAGWLFVALSVWIPLYLLLMQKRVYGQGWPVTIIKFSLFGLIYSYLLVVAVVFTVLASLASL